MLNDPVQQLDELAAGNVMRQRPQTLRTNARTRITAKIGHAGALTPNWETGRVKRTNERRRTRRAKVYGARSDGAICRGGYYRHWEVISVHKGYCNARSVHQLCPPSAHATHRRNNRDSRRPEASILLLSLAAHPTKPTCFFFWHLARGGWREVVCAYGAT